jgi:hypothetical protein
MRLSVKWFLWFSAIGIYVMFLGGIFYYNLFKWTFDAKLKQETLDMVRLYAPTLVRGLSRNQSAISMDEFDTVTRISRDRRIVALVYLNKYGEVRWFKDPSKITESFDQFSREVTLPTDAIARAWETKSPVILPVHSLPLYDIAIPLAFEGRSLGILDLQVSRETAVNVINSAMVKYGIGSVGVLLLLGVPLYFFLHNWILMPLLGLREAVEGVSFKTFELKFAPRPDEIGDVAEALKLFLFKVKSELSTAKVRESKRGTAEARWWQSILLAVVPKSHRAIVVDEDNSVLYTNFQLPVPSGITTASEQGISQATAKPHLLDVIDTQQQEVLRLIGIALDRPNQVVEADTTFRSEPCHVKAIHLEEDGELRRTLIVFEPKNLQQRAAMR